MQVLASSPRGAGGVRRDSLHLPDDLPGQANRAAAATPATDSHTSGTATPATGSEAAAEEPFSLFAAPAGPYQQQQQQAQPSSAAVAIPPRVAAGRGAEPVRPKVWALHRCAVCGGVPSVSAGACSACSDVEWVGIGLLVDRQIWFRRGLRVQVLWASVFAP